MSQPPGYTPSTDFSQEEANGVAGRSSVRTAALDAELSAIESTLDAILFNLALIQRDDTELADRVVKIHSLYDDIRALLALSGTNPRGDWVTATAYAAKDVVSQGTGTYVCVTAHTSGVFATDLAADKWIVVFDSSAYIASGISFTPTGTIASINVQLALAEVASEAAQKANNLSDLASAVTARANLGFPAISGNGSLIVGTAANTLGEKTPGTDGYALRALAAATGGVSYLPPPLGHTLLNGYVDWTVAGNVLTAALKTWAGTDPSATDPVFIAFRNVTAANGSITLRKVTAATSIAINNTALLGTVNATAFRLWCVAFDDGGTVRLGVINCLSTAAGAGAGRDVTGIYPLRGFGIASSTQEGDAADSAQVFYTDGAAVASKAYATLGYATWETGLATAGTWSAGPTRMQPFGPGVPLPGDVIQSQRSDTGALATGTTVLPLDDTIPQITEGDQYMSQAITPTSAANALRVQSEAAVTANIAGFTAVAALFQDATANALAAATAYGAVAAANIKPRVDKLLLAGATAATTFRLRAGANTAGTTTFNGAAAARTLGGVMDSFLEAQEIMG